MTRFAHRSDTPPGAARLHAGLVFALAVVALLSPGAAQIVTGQGSLPVAAGPSRSGAATGVPGGAGSVSPLPRTPRLVFAPGAAPDLPPGPPSFPGGDPLQIQGGSLLIARNDAVSPSGATVDSPTTTTALMHADTVLYAGNRFAALSPDHGRTFTGFDPATHFPHAHGGLSGNQQTLYVPGDDTNCLALWALQYAYSPFSGTNTIRVAAARGRDNLRSRTFHYYDITPYYGSLPSGTWLDLVSIGRSNTWFFLSANVHDALGAFQGTLTMRLNLSDMRNASPARYQVATTGASQPASLRFCEGCTTWMYYGAHVSSGGAPVIRIFAWDDNPAATAPFTTDKAISAWYAGTSSAPGPDGRDWLGGDDHRILGAYFAGGALSFLWGSSAGGGFARPFVRIAGFAPSAGFPLVGEASVWNPTIAFAYPSVSGNQSGNVGGTMAFGGGGNHPGLLAWVVDGLSGWGPLNNVLVAAGARGPSTNAWGRSFSAQRHPTYPNTYVGTGWTLDATGNAVPRLAWFGRQNDLPAPVTVTVDSIPVGGVPITVDTPDVFGAGAGVTPFARSYRPPQGMVWTAPAEVSSAGVRYAFDRWYLDGNAMPQGNRILEVPALGSAPVLARASFVRVRHVLSVGSTPTQGTSFTLAPFDANGAQGGFTPTSIVYEDQVAFRITANIVLNGALFDRWYVDGVPQTLGALSLDHVATGNRTLTAAYRIPVCGSFTPYGQSCGGLTHVATTARNPCGPFYNESVRYNVQGASTTAIGVLALGISNAVWNGAPLPLPMPGQPGCWIHTDMVLLANFTTDAFGVGGADVIIPFDRRLVDAHLYSQCIVLNAFAQLQFSNGIDTHIGGFR